jgi:hypothetical protein
LAGIPLAGRGEQGRSTALDRLDAKLIPADKQFAGQPAEFVGVLGEALAFHGDGMHQINNVGFSPDGRFLAIASGSTVKFWDLAGESPKKHAELSAFVARGFCWGITPDNRAIVLSKRGLTLWDLTAAPPQQIGEAKATGSTLHLSRDGKLVAAGLGGGSVGVFELVGKEFQSRFEVSGHKGGVDRVAISPDGKTVVSGAYPDSLRQWDMNGKPLNEWKVPQGHPWTVLFSPDSSLLVTNGSNRASVTRVLDLASGASREKAVLKGDIGRVRGAVFTRDGKKLITLSGDGKIIFWDARTFARLREWKLPSKTDLDWHNLVASSTGGLRPPLASRRLFGLMSRCTSPFSWACAKPQAAWRMYSHARATGSGPCCLTSRARSVPSMYSIARKCPRNPPSPEVVGPASYARTTCLEFRWLMTSISR